MLALTTLRQAVRSNVSAAFGATCRRRLQLGMQASAVRICSFACLTKFYIRTRHALPPDFGPQSTAALEKLVTKSLRGVVHSKSHEDIVYSGLLKGVEVRAGGIVSLTLALDAEYRALRAECVRVVSALPDVTAVRVHMDNPSLQV